MRKVPMWAWIVVAAFAAWFYVMRQRASGGVLGTSAGVSVGPVSANAAVVGSLLGSGGGDTSEPMAAGGSGGSFPERQASLPTTLLEAPPGASQQAYTTSSGGGSTSGGSSPSPTPSGSPTIQPFQLKNPPRV